MKKDSGPADPTPEAEPPAQDVPYRQAAQRPACARCAGDLSGGGTFTKDGSLVCGRCAAVASIAEAEARAAGPAAPTVMGRAVRFDPAWLRPRLLRKHGTAVSLSLGGLGLLGAPGALYTFFLDGPWFKLVTSAYVLLMGGTLWAAIVVANEHSDALARRAMPRPAAQEPAEPGVAFPKGPGAGTAVAAAAGPAMVAAGCGGVFVVIVLVMAVALVIGGWLFYKIFLQGGSTWNVG